MILLSLIETMYRKKCLFCLKKVVRNHNVFNNTFNITTIYFITITIVELRIYDKIQNAIILQ